jgi:5,10-methylenetetrahydromethanopterin reductase
VLEASGVPTQNRLRWIGAAGPKVPVDVYATGPKVISIAARVADRITFAVGATPERVRWGMDIAAEAMAAAGRDKSEVAFGMTLPVVVARTRAEGREVVAPSVAGYARFSVMHGSVVGPSSSSVRAALEQVHRNYEMDHHSQIESSHGRGLPDEVIDEFSVVGPVDYCIERLRPLVDLGLTKLQVLPSSFPADPSRREWDRLLATDVLPALR